MMSGQCPFTPMAFSVAWMPISCSAMYGMVATMPVIATSRASVDDPNRARTKSAGVTKPCTCDTDHSRITTRKISG